MAEVRIYGCRLGVEPTLSYVSNGNARCNYTVAENKRIKNASGEVVNKTVWHNITSWGSRAEADAKHLKKGAQVDIIGDIGYWDVETSQGKKVKAANINARSVQFRYIPKDENNNQEE